MRSLLAVIPSRRSTLLPVALSLLVSALARARPAPLDYDRYELFELFACADLVVTGEIVSIEPLPLPARSGVGSARAFTLEVERVLAGTASEQVRVRCFEDWTCARRWTGYATGQDVLVFLGPARDGLRSVLGGGGEGEMPLAAGEGEDVVVRGYRAREHPEVPHAVGGGEAIGARVPLLDLEQALALFRRAYAWRRGRGREQVARVEARDLDAVRRLSASSALGRTLVEQVVASDAWTGPRPDPDAGAEVLPLGLHPHSSGTPLGWVGDVDGDGLEELAVASSVRARGGVLRILFGAESGKPARASEIHEAEVVGPGKARTGFPAAAVPLGDLDGDGVPELLASAPAWGDGSRELERAGNLWVLQLEADGTLRAARSIGDAPAVRDAGIGGGFGLGAALAVLGDLDGDGFPEVAAARPTYSPLYRDRRSCLAVLSLGPGGALRWIRLVDAVECGFARAYGGSFAAALEGVGDVDGDGVPDLAFSNPWDDDGADACGAVWIAFLRADGGVRAVRKISAWHGGLDAPLRPRHQLGAAIAAPGDLDGDGTPDLLALGGDGVWVLFLAPDGTVRSSRREVNGRGEDEGFGTRLKTLVVGTRHGVDGALPLRIDGRLLRITSSGDVVAPRNGR